MWRWAGLAGCAVALAAGCSQRPADPATVNVSDLSVVWIVLDAAGARYLGAYGNTLPASPNVDALARDGGTVFRRAYAQSAWTLPSTASFLTGRYPRRRRQTSTQVRGPTLATTLQAAGFATAGFSENPYVTSTFGFDRGFDTFREYFPKALLDADPTGYTTDGARPTSDAIAWIDAHPSGRAFLYLHLLTPHSPYTPPAPFAGRFDPRYDGAIRGTTGTLLAINGGTLAVGPRDLDHLRLAYQENLAYADHQVGRVIEALRGAGRLDRTIVIVSADHGEAFREHGAMLHTTTLFEEMLHVPLVIRLPPRFGARPATFDGIVELRQVVPTLHHAFGIGGPSSTQTSLLRRLRARSPVAGMARAWTSDAGTLALGAIVTPKGKLVMDAKARRVALYDLARDPAEQHDVAGADPVRARRLARRLRQPRPPVAHGTGGPIDDDVVRRLHALGYE